MANPKFEFRPLTDADLPLLDSWLGRPHLIEWWAEQPSLNEVFGAL